jgi:hypothetical protein
MSLKDEAAGPEGQLFFLAEVWCLGVFEAARLQLLVSFQDGGGVLGLCITDNMKSHIRRN